MKVQLLPYGVLMSDNPVSNEHYVPRTPRNTRDRKKINRKPHYARNPGTVSNNYAEGVESMLHIILSDCSNGF